jgi:hypothetical protein
VNIVPLEKTSLTVPELPELVKDGPLIFTRNGQPLLAVKDVSGSDWESVALASNPRFMALIEESRRSNREEGGVGLDRVRQSLGINKMARRASRNTKRKKAR